MTVAAQPTHQRFIGIDLAWKSERHPTAIAVLTGDTSGVDLVALDATLYSLDKCATFLAQFIDGTVALAVDAPLVLRNRDGMRPCEREISRRYGSRHASCHSTNLGKYPNPSSVQLAEWLELHGFVHVPARNQQNRLMLEVYPHAAMVEMFTLTHTIKYKKGSVELRRKGLHTLQQYLGGMGRLSESLLRSSLASQLLTKSPSSLRGLALKELEDSLDALVCALLAYAFSRKPSTFTVVGDQHTGYIVNPAGSYARWMD